MKLLSYDVQFWLKTFHGSLYLLIFLCCFSFSNLTIKLNITRKKTQGGEIQYLTIIFFYTYRILEKNFCSIRRSHGQFWSRTYVANFSSSQKDTVGPTLFLRSLFSLPPPRTLSFPTELSWGGDQSWERGWSGLWWFASVKLRMVCKKCGKPLTHKEPKSRHWSHEMYVNVYHTDNRVKILNALEHKSFKIRIKFITRWFCLCY